MTESDTSFYYLEREKIIKPKIFFSKGSIRADEAGTEIKQGTTNMPNGNRPPKKEQRISHSNINRLWKLGDYNNDDEPFKTDRLTNLAEIFKYYAGQDWVPLKIKLPPFDPSDKITLNTPGGVEKQWREYLQKTGNT